MTYELNEQYQPIRKYITGLGMDDYEGHLEYSEVTDWSSHIFNAQYNPPWYTYMRDQVGTIYQVYDHKNHSIADSRAYDSFGNLVNQTGTTKTPLGFQGKYFDSESGLNYFYHRYYNPAIGRFTSEDPIGFDGGENFYSFVDNNSINYSDFFGLLRTHRYWSIEEKYDIKFFPKSFWSFMSDDFNAAGFTKPNVKADCCCKPIGNGKYQLDCSLNYEIKAYYYYTSTDPRDHEQIHLQTWKRGYQSLVDFLIKNEQIVFNSPTACEKLKKDVKDSVNHWYRWRRKKSNELAGH